jgi:ArsR family transcriptional regulator, arsenate/arsenite/antimonite-responsive transcriptional repressor
MTFEYMNVRVPHSAVNELLVAPMSRLFKALGDETRLRIVALLSHGELCVCHVEAALGVSQPHASRHLLVLKNAGVVEARRAGSWVYYRLARQPDLACQGQLRTLVKSFADQKLLARDVERLIKSKGPAACP